MTKSLRPHPSLDSIKYEAKQILKSHSSGDRSACSTLRGHPRFSSKSDDEILASRVTLQIVQHALALDYGFNDWRSLGDHISQKVVSNETVSLLDRLIHEYAELQQPSTFAKIRDLISDCPDVIETHGALALSRAFNAATTDLLQLLIDAGASFGALESETLFAASYQLKPSDTIDHFRIVFESDVSTGAAMSNGWSLLHTVAESGDSPALAELVLKHGGTEIMDAVHPTHPRYTALQLAVERRVGLASRRQVADILLEHGAFYDALSAAARNDVERLIEIRQMDVGRLEEIHPNGTTPIHWAAAAGATDCVAFLLEHGVDHAIRDRMQCTPLIIAASRPDNNPEKTVSYDMSRVVELLINAGADVDAQDVNGRTALHRAAFAGNDKVIELLLDHGADVRIVNKKGKRAIDTLRMGAKRLKERLSDKTVDF
ncbi:MAG: ankyrin repeat domain-containing protein [Pseudomonadota bacterium]